MEAAEQGPVDAVVKNRAQFHNRPYDWSAALSGELLREIARHAGVQNWGNLRCVCQNWRRAISLEVRTVRWTVPDHSVTPTLPLPPEPVPADVQRLARRAAAAGRPAGRCGAAANQAQQQHQEGQPQAPPQPQQPTTTGRGFAASSGRTPLHASPSTCLGNGNGNGNGPTHNLASTALAPSTNATTAAAAAGAPGPAAALGPAGTGPAEPAAAGDASFGRIAVVPRQAPAYLDHRPSLEPLACIFNLHRQSTVAAVAAAAAAAAAAARMRGQASDSQAAGVASSVGSSSIVVWSFLEAADKLAAAFPLYDNLSLNFAEPLPPAAGGGGGGGETGGGRWLQLEVSAALQQLLSCRLVSLNLSGHTPFPLFMAPPPPPLPLAPAAVPPPLLSGHPASVPALNGPARQLQMPSPQHPPERLQPPGPGAAAAGLPAEAVGAAAALQLQQGTGNVQQQQQQQQPQQEQQQRQRSGFPWQGYAFPVAGPESMTVADALEALNADTATAVRGNSGPDLTACGGGDYGASDAGGVFNHRRRMSVARDHTGFSLAGASPEGPFVVKAGSSVTHSEPTHPIRQVRQRCDAVMHGAAAVAVPPPRRAHLRGTEGSPGAAAAASAGNRQRGSPGGAPSRGSLDPRRDADRACRAANDGAGGGGGRVSNLCAPEHPEKQQPRLVHSRSPLHDHRQLTCDGEAGIHSWERDRRSGDVVASGRLEADASGAAGDGVGPQRSGSGLPNTPGDHGDGGCCCDAAAAAGSAADGGGGDPMDLANEGPALAVLMEVNGSAGNSDRGRSSADMDDGGVGSGVGVGGGPALPGDGGGAPQAVEFRCRKIHLAHLPPSPAVVAAVGAAVTPLDGFVLDDHSQGVRATREAGNNGSGGAGGSQDNGADGGGGSSDGDGSRRLGGGGTDGSGCTAGAVPAAQVAVGTAAASTAAGGGGAAEGQGGGSAAAAARAAPTSVRRMPIPGREQSLTGMLTKGAPFIGSGTDTSAGAFEATADTVRSAAAAAAAAVDGVAAGGTAAAATAWTLTHAVGRVPCTGCTNGGAMQQLSGGGAAAFTATAAAAAAATAAVAATIRAPPLLSRLSQLVSLTIAADFGFPSAQHLEAITALRGLRTLDMRGPKFMQVDIDASLQGRQACLHVGNEHVAVVARCSALTSLSLNHLHAVSGAQLVGLTALCKLSHLGLTDALSGNSVHGSHIKALADGLPELRSLDIGRVTFPPVNMPAQQQQNPTPALAIARVPAPTPAPPAAAGAVNTGHRQLPQSAQAVQPEPPQQQQGQPLPGVRRGSGSGSGGALAKARSSSPSYSLSYSQAWGPVLGLFRGLTSLHLQVACSFETELLSGIAALPLLEDFSMELLDVSPPQLAAMLEILAGPGGSGGGGADSGSPRQAAALRHRHGRRDGGGGGGAAAAGAGGDGGGASGCRLNCVLRGLTLTACMLYDEHLELMGRLRKLRCIRLDQVDIRTRDPDGWTALSGARSLESFSFRVWNNPVLSASNLCVLTNDSLAMMAANWPKLQQLSYSGKVVLTEKAEEHLAKMTCLNSAEITGTDGTVVRVWRSSVSGQLLRTVALPNTAAKVSSRNGYVTYSDSDDSANSEGSEASVNWMGEVGYVTSEYDAD